MTSTPQLIDVPGRGLVYGFTVGPMVVCRVEAPAGATGTQWLVECLPCQAAEAFSLENLATTAAREHQAKHHADTAGTP